MTHDTEMRFLMTVSTLTLAPALAFDAVTAFDGDDMLTEQVRSLTAILSVAPLSGRAIVSWIFDTTGTTLSQSTVSRAMAVAVALAGVNYPLNDESLDFGIVSSTVANLVRIRSVVPKFGGGQDGLKAAMVGFTEVVAFCDDVAAYWETVQQNRRDGKAAEVEVNHNDSTEDTATDSGAGSDDTDNSVGGGIPSIMSADKAATVLREIAGNIRAGRIAPTDELIAAAQAILAASVDAFATLDAITATDNAGALAAA